ncbi:MerR family transcriptional regulator [Gordonia sp. (in: high G+C Gram-positive bacteria)]|uniref:MerR family transcriptional regulator n=1 Tax=Gordonia sp. (in: high G+C Gram-positive bacteria) TaxID=84139 RepID=UPI0039E43879
MTGFPADLTMALTGVTKYQLANWRRTGLLVPEISTERPPLYSFRDLVALRTVAKLRASTSLQRIRRAFSNLGEFDLTDHPSEYRFAVHGKTIAVWTDEGFMDLVQEPGQYELYTLETIYRPFVNMRGEQVVDFERPRPRLEVNARRLGGWPTIEGSRVPFDTVADALTGDMAIRAEDLRRFYPGVTPVAAQDALDLAQEVASRRSA